MLPSTDLSDIAGQRLKSCSTHPRRLPVRRSCCTQNLEPDTVLAAGGLNERACLRQRYRLLETNIAAAYWSVRMRLVSPLCSRLYCHAKRECDADFCWHGECNSNDAGTAAPDQCGALLLACLGHPTCMNWRRLSMQSLTAANSHGRRPSKYPRHWRTLRVHSIIRVTELLTWRLGSSTTSARHGPHVHRENCERRPACLSLTRAACRAKARLMRLFDGLCTLFNVDARTDRTTDAILQQAQGFARMASDGSAIVRGGVLFQDAERRTQGVGRPFVGGRPGVMFADAIEREGQIA